MSKVAKRFLTGSDILDLVNRNTDLIALYATHPSAKIYGVPRGGVPVALVAASRWGFRIVDNPEEADALVDDLVDSGATREKFAHLGKPFIVLIDKEQEGTTDWIIFPWESSLEREQADNLTRTLQSHGIPATQQNLDSLSYFLSNYGGPRDSITGDLIL